MHRALIVCALIFVFTSGCATSNRGKTMELALAAGAAGAMYGQTKAEYKSQNSVMYGSMFAAGAALAGLYIFDEEKRAEEYRVKAMELQAKLDSSLASPDGLITQTRALLSQGRSDFTDSELPEEYQHLIRPGGWKLYEINRWVKKGSNRLVLESKLLEFTPPQIQPNSQTN